MDSLSHLKNRRKDQILNCWVASDDVLEVDLLILTTDDDEGVALNGGRIGARYAAEAVINCFQKMIAPHPQFRARHIQLCRGEGNLGERQKLYAEQIKEALQKFPSRTIIHLGGGHDHIYPLLKAIAAEKLLVINIDPHLDTRIDPIAHSGTPFRQFSEEKNSFKLIQWGTHSYSNAPANFTKLKNGEMHIVEDSLISREPERAHAIIMHELAECDGQSVLSLDADAIHASVMSAVSAVNFDGLKDETVNRVFEDYRLCAPGKKIVGIYEFNPLYDDHSQKGTRYLAQLIYRLIK